MLRENELVVDNFAGGGGASTGMELGLNRHVDIAINHDPQAIAMHKVNHPESKHYCESVWDVDPIEACNGRPVGLAWFSPDCKHFSKAKGGKPVDKNIRGLAWVTLKWAALVPVRIFMLENVEEFMTWGPVVDGKPCKELKGETFNGFIKALTTGLSLDSPVWKDVYQALFEFNYDIKSKLQVFKKIKNGLGYKVEHRLLKACDFGAPTTRKRFFLVGRNDSQAITWPHPTHSSPHSEAVKNGSLKPWRTAAECIDWSLPVKSIFNRKRPLAEKTLRRIAKGLEKFVFGSKAPFVVPAENTTPFITEHANASSQRNMPADEPLRTICAQVKGGHFALVAPTLIQTGYGERKGQEPRALDLHKPLGTIVAGGCKHGLVTSHMIKLRGTNIGHGTDEPVHTISAGGNHIGEVRAFLIKYYGTNIGHELNQPLQTVTEKHRFGLVTVQGQEYQIVDIGMRMLQPHELFAAQGFPEDYEISKDADGNKTTKVSQVARCGNAVCPPVAQALVKANFSSVPRQAAA